MENVSAGLVLGLESHLEGKDKKSVSSIKHFFNALRDLAHEPAGQSAVLCWLVGVDESQQQIHCLCTHITCKDVEVLFHSQLAYCSSAAHLACKER